MVDLGAVTDADPASLVEQANGADAQFSVSKVLIVPLGALPDIDNPRIIGIVSASKSKSIKLYYEQESYDTWLFFYGFNPEQLPEIVYYGQEDGEE